ncbi:hypothetical protein ACOME3_007085 [Neoechinorhynchus agilis]
MPQGAHRAQKLKRFFKLSTQPKQETPHEKNVNVSLLKPIIEKRFKRTTEKFSKQRARKPNLVKKIKRMHDANMICVVEKRVAECAQSVDNRPFSTVPFKK